MLYKILQLVFLNSVFLQANSFQIVANTNYKPPDEKYHSQLLDHFNPTVNTRFQQRYLISTEYWDNNGGPIFFYTGNEGNIETFANNTGFMWDIAPQFHAMLVFAEHRYYGKSNPYPNTALNSSSIDKFAQFTADQALADFAELITFLKSSYPRAAFSKVVAFGGSYGGMLAAWFRIKYPHIVDGSIAASAPVAMFLPLVKCEAFNQAITDSFAASANGKQCVDTIRNSYKSLISVASEKTGLNYISETFNLCSPFKNISQIDSLQNWMESGWGNVAMGNYPYPTSFLNPMPKWPVSAVCDRLSIKKPSQKQAVASLANAVQIFFNYTGAVKCLDLNAEIVPDISGNFWFFQTCTEFPMPFCADGKNDMFRPVNWTLESYSTTCKQTFGVAPRPKWPIINFGGHDVKSATNIVFSNGALDPWRVGGIFDSYYNRGITAIMIDKGAHHLDLRHANPLDPPSVVSARKVEVLEILKWVSK